MTRVARILPIATALAATPASASVIVGTGISANCLPFGCTFAGFPSTVYQQVDAAGTFSARSSIMAVRFGHDGFSGPTLNTGTFTLSVSTTAVTPATLDTVDFAAHIGSDNVQMFSSMLAPNFDRTFLTFNSSNPYVYDPAAGSLLLNFAGSGVTGPSTRAALSSAPTTAMPAAHSAAPPTSAL